MIDRYRQTELKYFIELDNKLKIFMVIVKQFNQTSLKKFIN